MTMSLTIIIVVQQQHPIHPKLYQNYYYNEYRDGILEIAKTIFNNTLDQIVDKTMHSSACVSV